MLRIDSYFSIETDLAGEMRSWPEFVDGFEYSVDLKDSATGEEVTVRFIEPKTDDDSPHVQIRSNQYGTLFDRVVGRTVFAMSAHTDDLMLMRWPDSKNSN
ncbi:MAG: hypothetical protein DMF63_09745 [Acidobacteria bacterium]|nr:MAG: hypothetical protein DMF63_09745 [Acidobacteriota bacterium]